MLDVIIGSAGAKVNIPPGVSGGTSVDARVRVFAQYVATIVQNTQGRNFCQTNRYHELHSLLYTRLASRGVQPEIITACNTQTLNRLNAEGGQIATHPDMIQAHTT